MAGLPHVNAMVPMDVATGDNVPTQLSVGTATSPAGGTIAMQ
jgi:uncharacterized protein (TIGR03437 family)